MRCTRRCAVVHMWPMSRTEAMITGVPASDAAITAEHVGIEAAGVHHFDAVAAQVARDLDQSSSRPTDGAGC